MKLPMNGRLELNFTIKPTIKPIPTIVANKSAFWAINCATPTRKLVIAVIRLDATAERADDTLV